MKINCYIDKTKIKLTIRCRGGSKANLKEGQSVVGALNNFQKLVTRVRCIQQFQIHFQNKQHNLKQINISVSETFSPDSHTSKGAINFQKGVQDLLQLFEGGATAPSCPPQIRHC